MGCIKRTVGNAIWTDGDLELILKGADTLTGSGNEALVYAYGNLTVSGSGKLTVTDNGTGGCMESENGILCFVGAKDAEITLFTNSETGVLYAPNGVILTNCCAAGAGTVGEELMQTVFFAGGYACVAEDTCAKAMKISYLSLGEHSLSVSKPDGPAPIDGKDYCWNGNVLHILSDGLTVSGTAADEIIYACCEELTLSNVNITVGSELEKNAIYAVGNLTLTLADGTVNKIVNKDKAENAYECIYAAGDLVIRGGGDLYATTESWYTIAADEAVVFSDNLGNVVLSSLYGPVAAKSGISVAEGCTALGCAKWKQLAAETDMKENVYTKWDSVDHCELFYVDYPTARDEYASAVKICGGKAGQKLHELRVSKAEGQPEYGVDYYWINPRNEEYDVLVINSNDLTVTGTTKDEIIHVCGTKLTLNDVNIETNDSYIIYGTGDLELCLAEKSVNKLTSLKVDGGYTVTAEGKVMIGGSGTLEVDKFDDEEYGVYAIYAGDTFCVKDDLGKLIVRGGSEDCGAIYAGYYSYVDLPDGYSMYGSADIYAAEASITDSVFADWDYYIGSDNSGDYAHAIRVVRNEKASNHSLKVTRSDGTSAVCGVDYDWENWGYYGENFHGLFIYSDGLTVSGTADNEIIYACCNDLTLDNVQIRGSIENDLLYSDSRSLTLTLKGENVLEQTAAEEMYDVLFAKGDLILQGDETSSLTVKSGYDYGIWSGNDLIVTGACSLDVNCVGEYGAFGGGGDVKIDTTGAVTVTAGDENAVYAGYDLTVTGNADVTAENDSSDYSAVWAGGNIVLGTVPNAKLLRDAAGGMKLLAKNLKGSALGCEGILTVGDGVDSVVLRGRDTSHGLGALYLRRVPALAEGMTAYGSVAADTAAESAAEEVAFASATDLDGVLTAFVGDTPAGTVVFGGERSEDDTFTVTFDANGGWCATADAATQADGTLERLPGAIRMGYDFMGWYTESVGGTEITADTVFEEDATVYAHWEKITPSIDPDDVIKNLESMVTFTGLCVSGVIAWIGGISAAGGDTGSSTGSDTPAALPVSDVTVPTGITGICEVKVDGRTVDSKYYTVNGTTVTLKKEFVQTLSAGEHTLVVKNGEETVTVKFNAQTGTKTVPSAETGDVGLALYGVLAISSVLGMGWVGRKKHD